MRIVKIFLTLLIIVIVFTLGYRIGLVKTQVEISYLYETLIRSALIQNYIKSSQLWEQAFNNESIATKAMSYGQAKGYSDAIRDLVITIFTKLLNKDE